MQTSRKNRGFSLAETLIVVAIVVILAALAFAYFNPRSMTKRQYDDYAKEIFIAAQNHLTLADTLNYLGRTKYGNQEPAQGSDGGEGGSTSDSGIYYYAVNVNAGEIHNLSNTSSVLNLMMPFGAIDETLRGGGKYIIRYQPVSGQVLDVFYWEATGRYPHENYSSSDYSDFLSKRNNKAALRNLESDHSVIGYYGGVSPSNGKAVELIRPQLWVENGDTLTVHVTDTNQVNHSLQLIISGESGGGPVVFKEDATNHDLQTDLENSVTGKLAAYTLTLDDVTTTDRKFSVVLDGSGIKPGDNLSIRAVVIDPGQATNIAASDEAQCNSLFADSTDLAEHRADISNIRHLENLDPAISGLNIGFTDALQITDLDWNTFMDGNAQVYVGNMTNGDYAPVTPAAALAYDGDSHTVANIKAEITGADAGMFGTLKAGSSVKNLRITDFSISGTNAGALAGSAADTDVSNVLACINLSSAASVSGVSSAGGLIGSLSGGSAPCTVEFCSAAATVDATGPAGGLIGIAGNVNVTGCAAGGQTKNGKYVDYNVVSSGNAGGLIGTLSGSVTSSYSTCSVSGATVGGLIGSASAGATVSNCYATGLVSGTTAEGAFAGTAVSASGCWYYEIINERPGTITENGVEIPVYNYLTAFPDGDNGVGKLDADVGTYNAKFGNAGSALPYDAVLTLYFAGNYPLPTVFNLGATQAAGQSYYVSIHHGDWPAPETLIMNRRS